MDLAYLGSKNPYDQMSFGDAFRQAHDSGESTFSWRGRVFNTNRKDKKETNARKQALQARSAPQSRSKPPAYSPQQIESMTAPQQDYPRLPYEHYTEDGPMLRYIKQKLMHGHNAGRSAFGMEEIFPDAKSGERVWQEMGQVPNNMMNTVLKGQDTMNGEVSPDYAAIEYKDKFLKYLMRSAAETARVGMGVTGAYQGGRAMELANKLRAAENFALRSKAAPGAYVPPSPTGLATRTEPYMK